MNNKKPLERIKNLIPSLPESDAKLGYNFITKRDFESLQLLIDSAIVRVTKGLSKEVVKEEYLKADLKGMRALKLEVDNYYSKIDSYSQYNDIDYNNYNDDFY